MLVIGVFFVPATTMVVVAASRISNKVVHLSRTEPKAVHHGLMSALDLQVMLHQYQAVQQLQALVVELLFAMPLQLRFQAVAQVAVPRYIQADNTNA